MKVIGLTGGIASGKSTVADLLEQHGFVIVDADVAAREAVAKGSEGLLEVQRVFGDRAIVDGEMDRKYIGSIVFNDLEKRKQLNAIIHPRVREIMERKKKKALTTHHVIMDIPLLFENNLEHTVDEVWVVYVPEELQKVRLMSRNGLSESEAEARIKSQISIEDKRKMADIIIHNSGTINDLKREIGTVVNHFNARLSTH